MCENWNISHITTRARNSKANGCVERFHRQVDSQMTLLVAAKGTEWDKYTGAIEYACRISTHDSTGYSPWEVLKATSPPLPLDDVLSIFDRQLFKDEAEYNLHVRDFPTSSPTSNSSCGTQPCRTPKRDRRPSSKHRHHQARLRAW